MVSSIAHRAGIRLRAELAEKQENCAGGGAELVDGTGRKPDQLVLCEVAAISSLGSDSLTGIARNAARLCATCRWKASFARSGPRRLRRALSYRQSCENQTLTRRWSSTNDERKRRADYRDATIYVFADSPSTSNCPAVVGTSPQTGEYRISEQTSGDGWEHVGIVQ
jgi:hypothetical protein